MKIPPCPRCHQVYSVKFSECGRQPTRYPLLLRCGHTFCVVCIQKLQRKEESVNCPTCQNPTKVGEGSELYKLLNPDCFMVGRMWTRRMDLEIQSQKIMGKPYTRGKKKETRNAAATAVNEGDIPCDECHINTATCQCFNCDSNMCSPCFAKIHQTSVTLRKHKPVGLMISISTDRQGSSGAIPPKKTRLRTCAVHDQCHIEYFCDDDNEPICSRCVILGDHKGHNVQTMEDKNKVLLSEMEPAVLEAQETVWRLEQSEKVLTEAMPLAQRDPQELSEEVRLHFLGLHSMLQAREEQLIDQIKAASRDASRPFRELKSHLEEEKLKLETALMDAARAKKGSMHRLVDADLILDSLRKAKDLPCVLTIQKEALCAPIKFECDMSVLDTIQQHGNVSIAGSSQMISVNMAGPDAEKPPVEELRTYCVSDLESQSNTDTASVTESVNVEEEKDIKDSGEEEDEAEEPVSATLMETKPSSDLPIKRLIVGHLENVTVTHIRTPAQFYVQVSKRQAQLDEMQKKINQHCRGTHGRKDLPKVVVEGSMVLAQYSQDKEWYRGRVNHVVAQRADQLKGPVLFEIFFIDYGNSELLPIQKLRKMCKRFTVSPMFAHECSLFDILPVDESVGWTRQSVQTMLEMTRAGPLFMKVVNNAGGVLEVDLGKAELDSLCPDERPVSVRDSLVFMEVAIFNTKSSHDTVCFPPVAYGMRRDYITMARIPKGTVIDIGINCVENPSLFYAQLYTQSTHGYLQRMLMAMQDTYSEETKHLYKVFCPTVGMICVAKYSKDKTWYRARVTRLPGHRTVEVQFVDYGNKEIVSHSNICKILDDHIKYPMQALEVSLADVEPQNGTWSEEAIEWFQSVADLQLCQFRVTADSEKPNTLVGILYVVNKETGQVCCVNYEIVRRGFAQSTGPFSSDECFTGITLSPEALPSISSSPLSESSTSPVSGAYRVGSGSWSSPHHPIKEQQDDLAFSRNFPPKPVKNAAGQEKRNRKARSLKKATSQEKGGNAQLQTKKEEELGVGESRELEKDLVQVVISGYLTPSEFFVQLHEKQLQLANLMTDLMSYENMAPSDHKWFPGEFCAAKSDHDDRWYRGLTLREDKPGAFDVKLVDYGHVDLIPVSQLRPLKHQHGKLECFAERCHMGNLIPTGTTDETKWSRTAIEFMPKLIGSWRLFIKLQGDATSHLGMPVDILVEEVIPETALEPVTFKYISVAAKLEDTGLAIPVKKPKGSDADPSPSRSKTDMFRTKPTPTFPDTASSDIGEGEETTCSIMVTKKEVTTVVQPNLQVAPHPVPSRSEVHCMPVFVDVDGTIYAQDYEEVDVCSNMRMKLQEYAESQAPEGILEVKIGQMCVAFFNEDHAWYRACVLDIHDDTVKVKYIDFGNTSEVEKTMLKLITPELCAVPELSYQFKLHGLHQMSGDGSWPAEYNEFLNSYVINRNCTALIMGSLEDRPLRVQLLEEDTGCSVVRGMQGAQLEIFNVNRPIEEFYERSQDIDNILTLSNPYFPLKLGEKNDRVNAMVTHVLLPGLVFLQRCEGPPDYQVPQDVLEFIKLMDGLNNLPPQTPGLTELPTRGEMCSACYSYDDRWYRGLVAKVFPEKREALILYVDYGNSESVPLDRLRVLPQRFQDTPAQAVRAHLNIDLPAGSDRWTIETYETMTQAIDLQKHLVLIKEVEPLTVELYRPDDTTFLSYSHVLEDGLVTLPSANPSQRSDDSSSDDESDFISDLD